MKKKTNSRGKQYSLQTYDFSSYSRKELEQFIKTSGKRLNQRLKQLEMSSMTTTSKMYQYNVNKAFDNKMGYYKTDKNGNPRFKLAVSKKNVNDRNYLVSLATEIQRGLDARSSTVSGIRKMIEENFEKGAKTFNERNKTSLSGKEYGEFLTAFAESGLSNIPYNEVLSNIKTEDINTLNKFISESDFSRDESLTKFLRDFQEYKADNRDLRSNKE